MNLLFLPFRGSEDGAAGYNGAHPSYGKILPPGGSRISEMRSAQSFGISPNCPHIRSPLCDRSTWELTKFVRELVALRKRHPVLSPEEEFMGIDRTGCGVPDVSYHGESAWRSSTFPAARSFRPTVPAVIIFRAVLVILSIRLIVLPVVRDEVRQDRVRRAGCIVPWRVRVEGVHGSVQQADWGLLQHGNNRNPLQLECVYPHICYLPIINKTVRGVISTFL